MDAKIVIAHVLMPAGEYWVGDPCYAVPDERWMEWLEAADYENQDRYLVAELDGQPVLGINTAYGDGVFYDVVGDEYPVDAGLIGLTPVGTAVPEPFGSHRVRFAEPVECYFEDHRGVIVLGSIRVETDPREDDERIW